MNSYQIRYFLKSLNLKVHTGVYAIDQLRYIVIQPLAIVFNNMPSSSVGMHWCAIIKKSKQSRIIFFDSLGLHPSFYGKEVMELIERLGGHFLYHNTNIQGFNTNTCGQHCCFYITKLFSNQTEKAMLKVYSRILSKNDRLVRNFMRKFSFPRFSKCLKRCLRDPFANICFQKSRKCFSFSN